MFSKSPIANKFYRYANTIVKIKKVQKTKNKIFVEDLSNGSSIVMPYQQSDLLLRRVFTVGEVAKIVERKSDTLRKYERRGLIPESKKFGEPFGSYKNWRIYDEDDVYSIVEFFSDRTAGRPVKEHSVKTKINTLNQKVKIMNRSANVR
jgi:hypothetical protein